MKYCAFTMKVQRYIFFKKKRIIKTYKYPHFLEHEFCNRCFSPRRKGSLQTSIMLTAILKL